MTRLPINRRYALALAGVAASFVIGNLGWSGLRASLRANEDPDSLKPEEIETIQILLTAIAHRGSAAATGERALAGLPDGETARGILGRLIRKLGVSPGKLAEMSIDQRRALLEGHIRSDHLSGDTVAIEGWELSLTEARLYALAHLDGG